jgi:hypothetical protein
MNVTLFFSLYAIFNFYVYFIAHIYAPASESVHRVQNGGVKTKAAVEAEKERQNIMNEFYQTELHDINDTFNEEE